MEILERVKSLLPKEAVSRAELEGSEIIVYTKDREFFKAHEDTVRQVVSQIKKRIEVRPEKNLVLDEEATKEKIKQIVPEDAKIKEIYFEPERSIVIIAAQKPGLVIGRGGETFRTIRSETLWMPRIERVPAIKSDIVENIRKVIHTEVKFRKEFLNKVGELIFSDRKSNRDWIRIIGLGGWREVGRSAALLETPKSKVLIDCGIKAGAVNSELIPIFNTKEFDYNELDAVIISHSHLDHCLHPDSYIQLPNGEITTIEEYHSSVYAGISSVDIDSSLKVEDVKVLEKVEIKSPSKLYKVRTQSKRIKVTGEHPFFVFDGRKIIVKRVKELKEGEFIATLKKINFEGASQDLPSLVRMLVVTDEGRGVLKEARIKKNLRQIDVARAVDSLQATISEIERGEHFVQREFIEKLAKFYNLDNFVGKHTEVKFNKSTKVKLPHKTSKEICQFLGYLLGDGDKYEKIRKGKRYTRLQVTDKDRKNLETYQSLLEKVFGIRGRIKESERKRLISNSPILLDFINSISLDILCKSPYRKIPKLIHKVSKEELASFIRGLFDAEGSVGHHQIKLTSTSYNIVQITQMLLLRFGIISHIYEERGIKRQIYQLTISHPSSIMKFYRTIGFGSVKKSETLKELIYVTGIGNGVGERVFGLPVSGKLIIEMAQKLGLRKTDLIKIGINYGHYLNGHVPSIDKAESIIKVLKKIADEKNIKLEELSHLQKLVSSDILWEPVEKIETIPSDTEYVYDLKVPGHHNYIANGIVVHNCGAVPMLYEYGFTGPLYMTTPALDLATLLWFDYVDVMQKSGTTPLYTVRGIKEAVKHAIPLEYSEVSDIAPDVRLTIQNAGHILGSGLLHFHVGEGMHNIVYALDQKFGRTTLLDPAFTDFQRVETLILESTYGGAQDIMPNRADSERELMDIVEKTMERNGIVLIPSFSVERAQEVMAILVEHGVQYPVYLDGMIWDANGIFTAYPEYLGRNIQKKIFQGDDPFLSPIFKRIASRQEREKAWEDKPCVIVSTSGMLTGGPVMSHLHQLAENPNNTLLFVGYQSEGSLGRRIQNGWKEMPVPADNGRVTTVELKMQVETIHGLSGHSDKNQLLGYVGHLSSKPDRVICIHGEPQKTQELARTINRIFRIPTDAPKDLESLRLR